MRVHRCRAWDDTRNHEPSHIRRYGTPSEGSRKSCGLVRSALEPLFYPLQALALPCFCMTWRNLITTLDTGRTSTWRLPRFSALYIAFRVSLRTLMRTMVDGLAKGWGGGAAGKGFLESSSTGERAARHKINKGGGGYVLCREYLLGGYFGRGELGFISLGFRGKRCSVVGSYLPSRLPLRVGAQRSVHLWPQHLVLGPK